MQGAGLVLHMSGSMPSHRRDSSRPATADDVAMLLQAREELDAAIADTARAAHYQGGESWSAIGRTLGVTRQAARQRFGL